MPKFRYGSRAVTDILKGLGIEKPKLFVKRKRVPRAKRGVFGGELSEATIALMQEFIRNTKENGRNGAGNMGHPWQKRIFLWERQNGLCACCERHTPFECATLEHLLPRAHGGDNQLGNLAMTCGGCNTFRKVECFAEFKKRALRMLGRGTIWPVDHTQQVRKRRAAKEANLAARDA